MKKWTLVILVATTLFAACSKDEDNDNSATSDSYFIEGKIDGTMHHAAYVCPNPGCAEITGNYDDFMEWIQMQRTISATDPIGWDILISDVFLDTWSVPDTLYATSWSGEEHLALSYYSGPHISDNNYLVDGVVLGDSSFQMIVSSKAGDVIQGTFHGLLRNGSDFDDTVRVTDGKFKVKLIRM